MKITTFVTGCALALALFLFAKRRPQEAPADFHAIVDLTRAESVQKTPLNAAAALKDSPTHIDAPAEYSGTLWTLDQIPPERLVAQLAVLDVRSDARNNPDYEITVDDIAKWEHIHGQIPMGSVVVAETGWENSSHPRANTGDSTRRPGYSEEAARFLVQARNVLGLGIDTPRLDSSLESNSSLKHPSAMAADNPVGQFTLSHSVYHLTNIANLAKVPATGSVIMVAPMKVQGSMEGPVRLLALVK